MDSSPCKLIERDMKSVTYNSLDCKTAIDYSSYSLAKSETFSPLVLSTCDSERILENESENASISSPSPFHSKKEPANSRLKTIGKKLSLMKKTYSSMDTKHCSNMSPKVRNSQNSPTNFFLQKYELLEILGKGAQGIVYKVENKENGMKYAAKKILVSDSETFQLIQNEIKLLKLVKHENIITIHEIINDDINNCVYCIFEYFPCKNLNDLLVSKHKFTIDQVKFIIQKVLLALEYLHEMNICHRDITLTNVLISEDFKLVKIIDFGISKIINDVTKCMMSPVGKGNNLPPEYEIQGFYTNKLDIWLTGILMLQIIYRAPFNTKKALLFFNKLSSQKNNEENSNFGFDFNALDFIKGLLNPEPEHRKSCTEALKHEWLNLSSSKDI